MKAYNSPDNLVQLLDGVVSSAARTIFYESRLAGIDSVTTLEEFRALPVTQLSDLRRQRLPDTLTEPEKVDWIVGASAGQFPTLAAMVESADEGAIRYDILADAVKEHLPLDESTVCTVVTTPERRYFASETATMLIAAGAQAHVFTDAGHARTYERLEILSPTIVIMLSSKLSEKKLPGSVKLCITFNREHRVTRFQQLDFYHVDGLGFLGQSTDLETYTLNSDVFYFEQSDEGKLIVTPLYARVQPALRVETEDAVELLSQAQLRLR